MTAYESYLIDVAIGRVDRRTLPPRELRDARVLARRAGLRMEPDNPRFTEVPAPAPALSPPSTQAAAAAAEKWRAMAHHAAKLLGVDTKLLGVDTEFLDPESMGRAIAMRSTEPREWRATAATIISLSGAGKLSPEDSPGSALQKFKDHLKSATT